MYPDDDDDYGESRWRNYRSYGAGGPGHQGPVDDKYPNGCFDWCFLGCGCIYLIVIVFVVYISFVSIFFK